MVEDIKSLSPELKAHALMYREMLEQSHIEISLPGIVKNVSAGISESQSSGSYKGVGISKERSKARIARLANAL